MGSPCPHWMQEECMRACCCLTHHWVPVVICMLVFYFVLGVLCSGHLWLCSESDSCSVQSVLKYSGEFLQDTAELCCLNSAWIVTHVSFHLSQGHMCIAAGLFSVIVSGSRCVGPPYLSLLLGGGGKGHPLLSLHLSRNNCIGCSCSLHDNACKSLNAGCSAWRMDLVRC